MMDSTTTDTTTDTTPAIRNNETMPAMYEIVKVNSFKMFQQSDSIPFVRKNNN